MALENENLAMALRTAYFEMHRKAKAHLKKYRITADQFVLLVILNENEGITQQKLTHIAKSDPNTIRAMLVILENSGLVERKKNPFDGRAYSVSMTKKGTLLFRKIVKQLIPVNDQMQRIFNNKELKQLLRALNRLTSELNTR